MSQCLRHFDPKVGKASPTEGTLPGAVYFIVKYQDDFLGAVVANAGVLLDACLTATIRYFSVFRYTSLPVSTCLLADVSLFCIPVFSLIRCWW